MTVLPQLEFNLFQDSHVTEMDLKHLSHSPSELVTYSLVKTKFAQEHIVLPYR